MDVSENEHRNRDQITRAQSVQSGLPASKEAMTEPPPPPSPNHGGTLVGTVPTHAADAERIILDAEAKAAGEWPPDFLRR
jgi:hypothetical protein